jgi:iron(III) transport system permease protein
MRTGRSSGAEPGTRRARRATIGLVAAALLFVVVLPLVDLVRAAADAVGDGGVEALRTGGGRALWNSTWTATAATVFALAIGSGGALLTERHAGRATPALRIAMVLPLLIPPFVTALGWTRAFGPGGLVDDLVGVTLPGLYGGWGIALVTGVHVAPLVYVVAAAALATRAHPELEWAARASGAGPIAAFRAVTFPLMRPALAGAAALAFVASMNSFAIPAVLGIPAGFATITTRIFGDLARSADPAAFSRVVVLATVLLVIALVVVIGADAGRGAPTRTGTAYEPVRSRRHRTWWNAAAWGYLAVTAAVPLLALVLTGLTRAVGLPATPGNWTLANFAEAIRGDFWGPAGRTLLLAAVAATAATALGAALAAVSRRGASRGLATAATLTFAVPGSALAVAVLLAYGPWLRDSLLIILVAYLAKFWALAHRSAAGSLGSLDRDLVRAARSSGAGPFTVVRTILAPLLRPALGAAWLLVFLFGLHELTMSSLLYGPGTATLAVVTLNVQQLGDVTVTAALAVILTLPGLAAAGPMLRRRNGRTP